MAKRRSEESYNRDTVGQFGDKKQPFDPSVVLSYGPSEIIRGASIGYSVGPSRMSRGFVAVADREEAAVQLAASRPAGTAGADPRFWLLTFRAYDVFEATAPAGSDAATQGFDSVSLLKMNLDLDHQSLRYNIFTVSKNEVLALADGPYRHHTNPERQAQLTEFWDARAARLTEVRQQLEVLADEEDACRAERLAGAA